MKVWSVNTQRKQSWNKGCTHCPRRASSMLLGCRRPQTQLVFELTLVQTHSTAWGCSSLSRQVKSWCFLPFSKRADNYRIDHKWVVLLKSIRLFLWGTGRKHGGDRSHWLITNVLSLTVKPSASTFNCFTFNSLNIWIKICQWWNTAAVAVQ